MTELTRYRIPISDVFGGMYKRRLHVPNGLSQMGVNSGPVQVPRSSSPYGITVQVRL